MIKLSGPLASIPGLCAANLTPSLVQRIQTLLPKSIEDWDLWIQCVQHNHVETQVLASLAKLDLKPPRWVIAILEDHSNAIRLQNRLRRESFLKLLALLKQHSIPVILLKGNAIAKEIYGDYDYKQMNEIDLLFKKESLDQVYQVYQQQAYVTLGSLGKNPRDQEQYSHHWPPFFSADLALFVGTHWNLVNPRSNIHIDAEDLWKRAEPLSYEGFEILRLSKEDFLHHLCVQLSPYKAGAKELADFYNTLSHWTSFNWNTFHEIVLQANSADAVYRSLSLSQGLFYLPAVQMYLEMLREKVSPEIIHETELRLETPENILRTRTNHISKIEKTYALFSLTENPLEKTYLFLQMWKLFFLPPLEDAAHLSFELVPTSLLKQVLFRIKAPWMISQAFAKDLSWNIFVAVALSHPWSLTKTWLRFLTQFRCKGIQEKANLLGINLQQMKSIVLKQWRT